MKKIAIVTAVIGLFCLITASGMAQTTTTLPKVQKKVVSRTQVTPAVEQSKTQKDTITTKVPDNTNSTTTTTTTTTKCQSGTTGTTNTTCTKKCPSSGTNCTHQCTKSTETKTVVPKQ
jgi:hypothetical protein